MRDINSIDSLRKAVGKLYFIEEGKPTGPCYTLPDSNNKGNHIASFLHISDAHIRDERLIDEDWLSKKIIRLFDIRVDTFHRDPFVDSFDSLTLASFLIAYGKTIETNGEYIKSSGLKPFVINGGDFLDFSLVTELMEMRKILRKVSGYYKDINDVCDVSIGMYSVAGNHDGLYFGNLSDKRTSTRGLGINKSEFILGNLLDDPCGYGFGNNEIVRKIRQGIKKQKECNIPFEKIDCDCINLAHIHRFTKKSYCKSIREQCLNICRVLKNIDLFKKKLIEPNDLRHPLAFRKLIKVPGDTEHTGLKLGYYSWTYPLKDKENDPNDPNDPNGIRYIVLDTRSNRKDDCLNSVQSRGAMDLFQLGWLYDQLKDALEKRECVVIFAHHSPFDMMVEFPLFFVEHNTTDIFRRMMSKFHNIIAYFYGHAHPKNVDWIKKKKDFNFPLIQTGSLIDYPQVGRMVDIFLRSPTNKDIEKFKKWNQEITEQKHRIAEIRWKFVRPKGIEYGNVPNGFLLQAILENSLHLAGKDEQKIIVDKWKNDPNMSDPELVSLDFSDVNVPSQDEIFKDCIHGRRIKNRIDDVREKNTLLK
ncbi:MAG: hypothetical protein GWN67_15120 [Phycisphaerae bacterium]|nr:hypothetical protein [Phycisphaerae bacterium]NIU09929.1 hypothetical protein [Phycisphaerae bacterium]NIU57667.1 hypothetical protein [Phycisphaerae bacterium]NIV02620.1 hypothetical protein [Phycisphaerae bacterium]